MRVPRGWRSVTVGAIVITAAAGISTAATAQQVMADADPAPSTKREADALLDRKVTLDLADVSLDRAIQTIATQAHVIVQYQSEVVARYTRSVTVHARALALRTVFEQIFAGTTLHIVARPNLRLVVVGTTPPADTLPAPASVGTIEGTITDSATGNPLVRANISIAGTKLTGTTSENGRFRLADVPAGDQIVTFRTLGYRSVNRTVAVTTGVAATVRIRLSPTATMLSGVVTTATGTQRRLEVGNDITTINADSVMRTAPVTSVTDLLDTRVPGLQIVRTSGVPGAPSRIRLRGANSISGNNDPIVIVNGIRVFAAQSDSVFGSTSLAKQHTTTSVGGRAVTNNYATRSPLDLIDPNTIETIEVFKGPSATAMYGSDAASGVIVITTKRGKAGRTRVDVVARQGTQYSPGGYPEVFFPFFHNSAGVVGSGTIGCARYIPTCILDSTAMFQALNIPYLTILGHGSESYGSATVSGGTDAITYSLTGTARSTAGLVRLPDIEVARYRKFYGVQPPSWMRHPDQLNEWSGAGALEIHPNVSSVVRVTTSITNSGQHGSSLDGAIGQLANLYVDQTVLDSVPLLQQFYERATSDRLRMTTALSGQTTTIPWLPLTATIGMDVTNSTDKSLIPRGVAQTNTADSAGYFSIGRGNTVATSWTVGANQIPLTRLASASVGLNYNRVAGDRTTSTAFSLPVGVDEPTQFTCAGTVANCIPSLQTSVTTSTYGWFFEPRLNWNSRFFVTPGFRLDGGSASGSNAGLSGFPKMSVSWVAVDQEGKAPLFGVLSFLRPRLSFGIAGVQPGPSDRLRLLNDTVVTLDGGATTGQGVGVSRFLGNVLLRPERTREIEGGGDISLWGTRVQLDATVSHKMTHDAIVNIPVAVSVNGGGTINTNIGTVRNTSVELTSNVQLVELSRVGWHTGMTMSATRNRLVQLAPGVNPITINDGGNTGIDTRFVPGYPLNGRWVRPVLGHSDTNHDGIIQPSEVLVGDSSVFVGQQDPNYRVVFTNDVTLFQRFTVNATVDYTNGLTQINLSQQGIQRALNDPASSLDDQAAVVVLPDAGQPRAYQTPYGVVQTISILRFSSLSMRYALPSSFARRFRASALSVAVQGTNLGLTSNYRGKDPNVNAFSTGNLTSDTGQLPQPRTWNLQFNLSL